MGWLPYKRQNRDVLCLSERRKPGKSRGGEGALVIGTVSQVEVNYDSYAIMTLNDAQGAARPASTEDKVDENDGIRVVNNRTQDERAEKMS